MTLEKFLKMYKLVPLIKQPGDNQYIKRYALMDRKLNDLDTGKAIAELQFARNKSLKWEGTVIWQDLTKTRDLSALILTMDLEEDAKLQMNVHLAKLV